jgi:hypothetical protein
MTWWITALRTANDMLTCNYSAPQCIVLDEFVPITNWYSYTV